MKRVKRLFLIAILGSGIFCGRLWAQTEEKQLQTKQQEMDTDVINAPAQKNRVAALAKQFNVPARTVEEMRNEGKGWGEATIQLSIAERLAKTDPAAYPDMASALAKVDSLRDQGKGWGNISKELGFKLGPVISEVKHAQHEFRSEKPKKAERSERKNSIDRSSRPDRSDRPEKAQRGKN